MEKCTAIKSGSREDMPQHIAVIMDGNGRWAKERSLSRTEGHRRGMKVVENIVEESVKCGVKVLSLYAFSAENWKRPRKEIDILMHYFYNFLRVKYRKLLKNHIKLRIMGDIEALPVKLRGELRKVQEKTKDNAGLIINLGLNYGGRQEIISAVKRIIESIKKGEFDLSYLNNNNFSDFLYTAGLPDPDLLIRTSGEMRLSNFMLWQLSYSELYFCKKYWPDFTKDDFLAAIFKYQQRERKFGDINAA